MTFRSLLGVAGPLSVVASVCLAQGPINGVDPISNWPAPLYWQPTVAKTVHHQRAGIATEAISRDAVAPSGSPAIYVAMTPCRMVDTRNAPTGVFPSGSPFGPPSFSAGQTRTIPAATSACGVPVGVIAYSLNIAVVPLGSTMRWLTAWNTGSTQPNAATLNDQIGQVTSNSAVVPAGTSGSFDVYVTDATHVIIDINGYYTAGTPLTAGQPSYNLGIGIGSLTANTTGSWNTGVGVGSLETNGAGAKNTGVGAFALAANTIGQENTAVGNNALASATVGTGNTAVGYNALSLNAGANGNRNSAFGADTLVANSAGTDNTAVGQNALNLATGNSNIAIGSNAGANLLGGSSNIFIGHRGAVDGSDNAAIRIGTGQTTTYIAGIRGVTTGGSAVAVVIDANGQLGTTSSSIRVKRDVHELGDTSNALMQLHPVQFRYISQGPDAAVQYGLIAEEVAKIAPELVARDSKGQIETVFYDKVNIMLLNEVQKQQHIIDTQAEQLQQQSTKIDEQGAKLSALQSVVDKLLQAQQQSH